MCAGPSQRVGGPVTGRQRFSLLACDPCSVSVLPSERRVGMLSPETTPRQGFLHVGRLFHETSASRKPPLRPCRGADMVFPCPGACRTSGQIPPLNRYLRCRRPDPECADLAPSI